MPLSFNAFSNHNVGKLKPTEFHTSKSIDKDSLSDTVNNFYDYVYCTYCLHAKEEEDSLYISNAPLSKLKLQAKQRLFPSTSSTETCTMLFLTNLAEPEWVQVSCITRYIFDIFCMESSSETELHDTSMSLQMMICSRSEIMMKQSCFQFLWYSKRQMSGELSQNYFSTSLVLKNRSLFSILFNAVSTDFPPLLFGSPNNDSHFKYLLQTKIFNIDKFEVNLIDFDRAEGFVVFHTRKEEVIAGNNLLRCANGSYISHLHLYNHFRDGSGENSNASEHCHGAQNHTRSTRQSKILTKDGISGRCSKLFHKDIHGWCHPYVSVTKKETLPKPNKQYSCSHDKQIDMSLKDDIAPDCGPEAEDEPILVSLLRHHKVSQCRHPFELPCLQGHSKCFNLSQTCIYELDKFHHLSPCRNGGHLNYCEHFKCNTNYKCQYSYCIQGSYVCNGRRDCPHGDDELYSPICGPQHGCKNMLKCKGTHNVCLHIENNCDDKVDCPLGDDEFLCELKFVQCPTRCNCQFLGVHCNSLEQLPLLLHTFYPYIYFSLENIFIHSLSIFVSKFSSLQFVEILSCGLTEICMTNLSNLVHLNAQSNNIPVITKFCFKLMVNLKVLQLDKNRIIRIQPKSFWNLKELKLLSLSGNSLPQLGSNVLPVLPSLEYILIENSNTTEISVLALHNNNVDFVVTDNYHLCCVAGTKSCCNAHRPWYISCSQLLPLKSFDVLFGCVLLLIIFMNTVSAGLHHFEQSSQKTFSTIVKCLNMSNMLLSTYLLLLWVPNFVLNKRFMVEELSWRSSSLCTAALGIMTWFSWCSTSLYSMHSVSRLMVVVSPMDTRFKKETFVTKSALTLFFCCFTLSGSFTLGSKLTTKTLATSLCLLFADPSHSCVTVTVFVWLITIIQSIAFTSIFISHYFIVKRVTMSAQTMKTCSSRTSSDKMMKIQLTLLTLSVAITWIPADICFTALLFVPRYPIHLLFWIVILVVPLNTIFSPIIMIVVFIRKTLNASLKTTASAGITEKGETLASL